MLQISSQLNKRITVVFKTGIDNNRKSHLAPYSLSQLTSTVLITQVIFWSFIESSLALIACCLPTVHSLFHKSSLESAIRSIRSLASLRSHDPNDSRDPRTAPIGQAVHNSSTASHAEMIPSFLEAGGVEHYAMKDLSKSSQESPHPQGAISVTNTISRTEEGEGRRR
jgi:hypothetical protein